MKHIFVLVSALFVATPAARSDILVVQMDRQGTNVEYRIQSKAIGRTELKSTMARLGALSATVQIHVQTTSTVSASDLMALVAMLKECGLTRVVVWASGESNGQKGTRLMSLQLLTEPIQFCVGVESRDFIPDDDPSWVVITSDQGEGTEHRTNTKHRACSSLHPPADASPKPPM